MRCRDRERLCAGADGVEICAVVQNGLSNRQHGIGIGLWHESKWVIRIYFELTRIGGLHFRIQSRNFVFLGRQPAWSERGGRGGGENVVIAPTSTQALLHLTYVLIV